MHQLQNYRQEEPVYDGKSYTFSSTLHDGTLKLYTHHLTAPTIRGEQPEYHMSQLAAYALTNNRETFIQGATAYRNLRDLAKEYRDTFIKNANFRYQQDATAVKESTKTATLRRSGSGRELNDLGIRPFSGKHQQIITDIIFDCRTSLAGMKI
ncbi:hypothetical protein DHEL01_v212546 [Diaporthe helianthi]|uniref:Uncharacterized protein n=1 Tax=Diaporthe helianthi TaxID=158607 RepID=A0A2P5HFL5_DIAHE|nr:hypothetical protein DHEL01_v212546 [Diaporthe helianthi]